MKTENIDNLSRSEKFERVKGACRKQAKKGICLEIVFFILFIILIFNLSWVNRDHGTGYIIYACVTLFFLIALVVFAVETFRFLKHLASVNIVVLMIAMLIYSYFDDDIMFRSLYDNPVSEFTSELTDIMLRTKDPANEEINDQLEDLIDPK